MANHKGWIGVDLDGTLAFYEKWQGHEHIGEPIKPMLDRVKQWIGEGKDVRIFTARMTHHGKELNGATVDAVTPIEEWCLKHIGLILPVTNVKDFGMIELWDDRCVSVIPNSGRIMYV